MYSKVKTFQLLKRCVLGMSEEGGRENEEARKIIYPRINSQIKIACNSELSLHGNQAMLLKKKRLKTVGRCFLIDGILVFVFSMWDWN